MEVETCVWCEDLPKLGVAVNAAEAAFVVDVLMGHKSLQRVHRLCTSEARLPLWRAKLL